MNQNRNVNNDVHGTGTASEGASSGRCSVDEQRRPGRNQATARMKWTKEMNIVVMECFYSANPFDENGVPVRGYRQRMYREWRERGMFNTSEQRLCDQARAIRKMVGCQIVASRSNFLHNLQWMYWHTLLWRFKYSFWARTVHSLTI